MMNDRSALLRLLSCLAACALIFLSSRAAFAEDQDCDLDQETYARMLNEGSYPDCNRNGLPDPCDLRPRGLRFTTRELKTLPGTNYSLRGAVFAEANGDVVPDLIAFNVINNQHRLLVARSQGASAFAVPEEYQASADGQILPLRGPQGTDIYIVGTTTSRFQNMGNGTFAAEQSIAPAIEGGELIVVDADNDGLDDVIVIRQSAVILYIRQSDGSFVETQTIASGLSVSGHWLFGSPQERDLVLHMRESAGARVLFFTQSSGGLFQQTQDRRFPSFTGNGYKLFVGNFLGTSREDLRFISDGPTDSNDVGTLYIDPAPGAELPSPTVINVPENISGTWDINSDGFLDLTRIALSAASINFYAYNLDTFLNDRSRFLLASSIGYSLVSRSNLLSSHYDAVLDGDFTGDGQLDRIALNVETVGVSNSTSYSIQLIQQTSTYPLTLTDSDSNENGIPDSCEEAGNGVHHYSVWNGFLGLLNILELVNTSSEAQTARVLLRNISGAIVDSVDVPLPSKAEFDVILNDLPSFSTSSYGVVEVLDRGDVTGGVSYYRYTSAPSKARARFDTGDYDFAFQLPLSTFTYGGSRTLFNTYQPSRAARDSRIPIVQWLTVVNFAPHQATFRMTTTRDDGTVLAQRELSLAPFERADVDGGHDVAGANALGSHVVEPEDHSVPYIAFVTRYGGTSDPDRFAYAFPVRTTFDTMWEGSRSRVIPISTGGEAENWLELGNTAGSDSQAIVSIFSPGQSFATTVTLPPFQQLHLRMGDFIGSSASGYARVLAGPAVIADAVSYYYDPVTGSIASAYLSPPAVEQNNVSLWYNRYLGMFNWLRVDGGCDFTLRPTMFATTLPAHTFFLSQSGSMDLDLHNSERFGTQPDTYGLVQLDASCSLSTEMLRIRPTPTGLFDFVMRIGAN